MFCYRILRSCLLLLLTSVAAELARGSELTELVADHVFSDIHRDFTTFFLPLSFMARTFFSRLTAMYGPFLSERLIIFLRV